jgi:serine/threonine-protein kinase RsbW
MTCKVNDPGKTFELILHSKIAHISKVEKFLYEIREKLGIDEEHFYKLLVATTEAVNNGIIHGNKRDPEKKVILRCTQTDSVLKVSVRDEGAGFDSEKLPDPLADENLMRDHGRGVFLIRSLMDKVEYRHSASGSEVVMELRLK